MLSDTERKILSIIRKTHPITRHNLLKQTTSLSSVKKTISILKKKGMINSYKDGKKSLLKINNNFTYFIGIELLPHCVRYSILDFSLKNLLSKTINTQIDYSTIDGLNNLSNSIIDIIREKSIHSSQVQGISISVPGIVTLDNSSVLYSETMNIKNFNLSRKLKGILNIPVKIINDANAGALGSMWFSSDKSRKCKNIAFLFINEKISGVGTGLIINGSLYTGWKGTSGEVGPHLEPISVLTEKGLKEVKEHNIKLELPKDGPPSLASIHEAYRNGCALSRYILDRITMVVQEEIIKIIAFINPEQLVLGGDYIAAKYFVNNILISSIEDELTYQFPEISIMPDIIFSPLEEFAISIGACILFAEEFYKA